MLQQFHLRAVRGFPDPTLVTIMDAETGAVCANVEADTIFQLEPDETKPERWQLVFWQARGAGASRTGRAG